MRLRSALFLAVVMVPLAAACGPDEAAPVSTTTVTVTEAPTTMPGPSTMTTTTTATTSTSTSSTTTTTTTVPLDVTSPEILVVNEQGVHQIDPAGDVSRLVVGRVVAAVDDTRGGLLFQVEQGRRCFGSHDCADLPDDKATEIWWVPRNGSIPQELLVPTPGTDHELTLRDAYSTDTGFVVIYTRHEGYVPFEYPPSMFDRLRSYDVDTGEIQELYRVRGYEWDLAEISAGGGLVTATEMQLAGSGCILVDSSGAAVSRPGVPASRSCFEEGAVCPCSCALSSDATKVAFLDQPTWDAPPELVVAEVATGRELARVVLPAGDDQSPSSLSVDGAWVLVNWRGWAGGQEVYSRATLYDLDDLQAGAQQLPVAGSARLVTVPADVDGPIPAPTHIGLRSDGLATFEELVATPRAGG